MRKGRRRELSLSILDDNLAITAETRVLEDAGRDKNSRDTAFVVLDVDGAITADDELSTGKNTV